MSAYYGKSKKGKKREPDQGVLKQISDRQAYPIPYSPQH
jgi:hypothetical protein